MEYYYITQYPIDLCKQYLKNRNVKDTFEYQLEEVDGRIFITFLEYRMSIRSLSTSPKPKFEVEFFNNGPNTVIKVVFLKRFLQPVPFVHEYNINKFWINKLDARVIKNGKVQ